MAVSIDILNTNFQRSPVPPYGSFRHGVESPPGLQCFDRRRWCTEQENVTDQDAVEKAVSGEHLCCAVCAAPITSSSEALERDHNHVHYFTNPHGIGYRIGCFAHAGGLAALGPEMAEHTWFTGYQWRIMLCGQCNTLLGWRFRSPDDEFFGLIVAQLLPCRTIGTA